MDRDDLANILKKKETDANIKTEINPDELFYEFHEDRSSEEPKTLKEWIADYPAQKEELVTWAVGLSELNYAESAPPDPVADARTLEIGMRALSRMKYRTKTEVAAAPIVSLLEAARLQGMDPKQFAERLNLDKPMVTKLNQKLMQVVTIPSTLIQKIAEELKVGVQQVQDYLNRPSTLASGVSYRSETKPEIGSQQPFSEAIRSSLTLSEERKTYWLDATQAENE